MSTQVAQRHKVNNFPQEIPISLHNSPAKIQSNKNYYHNNTRDSKSVNTSIETKKKDGQKKQSKQTLNKILTNGDDKNTVAYLNNNSRSYLKEIPQQSSIFYHHQQSSQSQQQQLQQQLQINQIQNNISSLHTKKQDITSPGGNKLNDQSVLFQTPPRTKVLNYSNWDQNLDNTLPYIHQSNKISQKQSQFMHLQTTQKKHSPQQRTISSKTKKNEDILTPYIYGNNPFKNPINGATLSGGFRYQPPFKQTVKKVVKKNNNYANPSLSENEGDDNDGNATFHHHHLHHHQYRNKNELDNSLHPQNILDSILQPQKLEPIIANQMNNTQRNNNEVSKTRASASLYNSPGGRDAFTDSEANDQTSSSSKRYSRKKYSVKRRSKEDQQILFDSTPIHDHDQDDRLAIHLQPSKLDNMSNNNDTNQFIHPIMTQRNNWSSSESNNKQESDKQYLTQYSSTMAYNQFQEQNLLNNNENSRVHSTSVSGGMQPNITNLRINNQSVDLSTNQISNTNDQIIDHSPPLIQQNNDQIPFTQKTDNSDDTTPMSGTSGGLGFNPIPKNQLRQQDNLLQPLDPKYTKQQNSESRLYDSAQEDDGKALSSVPSKPSYQYNINEIEMGNDQSHFKKMGEIHPIYNQKSHKGQHQRREERSNSYRFQHLQQKESQLVNMANRENEFGTKLQVKKSSVGTANEMSSLLPHQNIILNSRMNDLKKQIQVKDIQRVNIHVELNQKSKGDKSESKNKSKQLIQNQNILGIPQNQLSQLISNQAPQQQKQQQQQQHSRKHQKTPSALENGIYLYNNDFEFEDEDTQNSEKQKQQIQQQQGEQNNMNNDVQEQEYSSIAVNNSLKDSENENIANNTSDVSTSISSPNPSILNERKNGQQSKEPYTRQKITEKSHSQMPHQQTQNNLPNDSYLQGNSLESERKVTQSNSLSPEIISKNDSQLNKQKLAKACIRFSVLGGGETIEAEDFSLRGIDSNGQAINKFRINIKNVLEIEHYMEQICQHLHNQSYEYIHSAELFINTINEDPLYNINQVHRFFGDEKLCRVGKVLTVLELISVYLIIKIGRIKKTQIRSYYAKMKSLLTYIHQSFLLFWDQLYLLFSQNIQDKDCLERLRERIEEKRQVKLGNKKSSYLQLKQNYDIICNIIKPMIKDVKEISGDIAKLFKIFEDQSIVDTFNSIKNIFAGDIIDNDDKKEQENDQNKMNSSLERQIHTTNRRVRNVKPYLPTSDSNTKPYTLVLDLDETLIHFFETRNGGQYQKRPFCDKFLREMNKLYELVIFTAGTEEYANWVLDSLDKCKFISYRLYRQHTNFTNCVYVKDLSKIGRDLSKTIIVDNVPENFRLQRDNGIGIKSWYNDRNDCALNDLLPPLTELAQSNPEDVRVALKKLRQKYPPHKVRGNFDLPY